MSATSTAVSPGPLAKISATPIATASGSEIILGLDGEKGALPCYGCLWYGKTIPVQECFGGSFLYFQRGLVFFQWLV